MKIRAEVTLPDSLAPRNPCNPQSADVNRLGGMRQKGRGYIGRYLWSNCHRTQSLALVFLDLKMRSYFIIWRLYFVLNKMRLFRLLTQKLLCFSNFIYNFNDFSWHSANCLLLSLLLLRIKPRASHILDKYLITSKTNSWPCYYYLCFTDNKIVNLENSEWPKWLFWTLMQLNVNLVLGDPISYTISSAPKLSNVGERLVMI